MSNMLRGQRAVLYLRAGCLGLLLVLGCGSERKEQDVKLDDMDQPLSADIAKKTLLEMDSGQIPAGVIVPPPKDEPITVLNADEIAVGIWNCNLKKKTFHASAFYPNAPLHKMNEVSGVFQQTPGGKWIAKLTQSQSGH